MAGQSGRLLDSSKQDLSDFEIQITNVQQRCQFLPPEKALEASNGNRVIPHGTRLKIMEMNDDLRVHWSCQRGVEPAREVLPK